MKSRPGNIYKNTQRNVGVNRFTMDTVVKQHIPELVIEEPIQEPIQELIQEPIQELIQEPIQEPIQEIKQEENELQRTQVEQTEISSGSRDIRDSNTRFSKGDKQDPPRKSRI